MYVTLLSQYQLNPYGINNHYNTTDKWQIETTVTHMVSHGRNVSRIMIFINGLKKSCPYWIPITDNNPLEILPRCLVWEAEWSRWAISWWKSMMFGHFDRANKCERMTGRNCMHCACNVLCKSTHLWQFGIPVANSYTPSSVSTGMGDRVRVRLPGA